MRRLAILFLAGLMFFPAGAGARLGESWPQIVKRFGQPTKCGATMLTTNDTCRFETTDFIVLISFSNRISVCEMYSATNGVMDDEAAAILMKLQAGTSTWQRIETDTFLQEGYLRSDGLALAMRDRSTPGPSGRGGIAFFARPFWKAFDDRHDAKNADRFKGF